MNTQELKLTQYTTELLQKIQAQEISYIDNDKFSDPQCEAELFDSSHNLPDAPSWSAYDAINESNNNKVALTSEQERLVFLQYHFSCKRVLALREAVAKDMTQENIESLISWYEKSQNLRGYLVACNMRMISFMLDRWSKQKLNSHDLISDAQISLINAIDKFDTNRGKFSTYLYWAINNAFGRMNKNRAKINSHTTDLDPGNVDIIADKQDDELAFRLDALHQILDNNIANLNDDELAILRIRYLDNQGKRPSIEKVSISLDINKHKVTRCEKSALEKIRLAFQREFVDNPEKVGPMIENKAIIKCKSDNEEHNRRRTEMTDEAKTTENVDTVEETVVEETVVETKTEKTPLFKIWVDDNGTEVDRKPLGPGKPPLGSHKDGAGNLICPVAKEKIKVNGDYVVIDETGTVLSREPRKAGKGRPKKGFKKATEGEFIGDYTNYTTKAEWDAAQAPAEATTEATTETQEAPEVVAVEQTEPAEA